jgi:hypothetical protein
VRTAQATLGALLPALLALLAVSSLRGCGWTVTRADNALVRFYAIESGIGDPLAPAAFAGAAANGVSLAIDPELESLLAAEIGADASVGLDTDLQIQKLKKLAASKIASGAPSSNGFAATGDAARLDEFSAPPSAAGSVSDKGAVRGDAASAPVPFLCRAAFSAWPLLFLAMISLRLGLGYAADWAAALISSAGAAATPKSSAASSSFDADPAAGSGGILSMLQMAAGANGGAQGGKPGLLSMIMKYGPKLLPVFKSLGAVARDVSTFLFVYVVAADFFS